MFLWSRIINKFNFPLLYLKPFNDISVILVYCMMAVSFIVVENWRTLRKPWTCSKQLTNSITYSGVKYTSTWVGIEMPTLVMTSTDCINSVARKMSSRVYVCSCVYLCIHVLLGYHSCLCFYKFWIRFGNVLML